MERRAGGKTEKNFMWTILPTALRKSPRHFIRIKLSYDSRISRATNTARLWEAIFLSQSRKTRCSDGEERLDITTQSSKRRFFWNAEHSAKSAWIWDSTTQFLWFHSAER